MLLRQMKYFLAVADCKSFSEAAVQCFISQSAISQQIKILEDELEIELIQRSNRRFQLTPAGEYFYLKSKKIVQEANALKLALKQIKQHEQGVFRLGCLNGYQLETICTAINEILAAHPDFNIAIFWGEHDELLAKLQQKELDLIICDVRADDNAEALEKCFLAEEPILAAISTRSPLAKQPAIDIQQLEDLECVLFLPPKAREKEEQHYQKLLKFCGKYFYPPRASTAISHIINSPAFLPLLYRAANITAYSSFIKALPLQAENAVLTNQYNAFWQAETKATEQTKIRRLILSKLQEKISS